jgi:hypothetical protein
MSGNTVAIAPMTDDLAPGLERTTDGMKPRSMHMGQAIGYYLTNADFTPDGRREMRALIRSHLTTWVHANIWTFDYIAHMSWCLSVDLPPTFGTDDFKRQVPLIPAGYIDRLHRFVRRVRIDPRQPSGLDQAIAEGQ